MGTKQKYVFCDLHGEAWILGGIMLCVLPGWTLAGKLNWR